MLPRKILRFFGCGVVSLEDGMTGMTYNGEKYSGSQETSTRNVNENKNILNMINKVENLCHEGTWGIFLQDHIKHLSQAKAFYQSRFKPNLVIQVSRCVLMEKAEKPIKYIRIRKV